MPQATATHLEAGDRAPAFNLKDQDERPVSLRTLAGKRVVLYFYPKDMTSGCTTEAIQFTARAKEFAKRNAVLLGVSPDTCESHRRFIEKEDLSVTLLADPEHEALEAYGVWREKSMYGRTYMGVVRSTFLIDPTGSIAFVWPKVKADGHAAEVLAKLDELGGA